MRKGKFLIIGLCALSAAALLGWSIRKAPFTASIRLPREFEATVVVIEKAGEREWMVPKAAVVEPEGGNGAYVFRLEKLRAKRIGVFPAGSSGEKLIVKSGLLAPGDPVLIDPASIQDGAAIAVTGGLDERSLVQLTLNAAIAAVNEASLKESMRFVSPGYADPLGFDFRLMSGFLSRAYKEFAQPRLEVVDSPVIEIQGTEAVVQGSIRLQAFYRGRRSYLLGGSDSSNAVWMRMEKLSAGWKLTELTGLRPLGLDEKFMKFLGAEVGLPLNAHEKVEKKEFCMPCRSKMAERFGTGK
jgi:hypothetical protein